MIVIGICGASGSGKSTLAYELAEAIGARCTVINHDCYYKDHSHLPFEEREEFLPCCEKYGVHLIHMVAITSQERIMAIARAATGFLYIMACPGGTTEELAHIMEVVRSVSTIPCAVCLTADDAPQFWETAALVDGVIEDAPIVSLCGRYGSAAHRHVGARTRQVVHQLLSL